jgi:aryl-alcohol dehydrogenase (NADP+)
MTEVENSLRRLNTDYIDLYYAHAPDYNTPIDETLRAFDDLVRQGKVRYIACSNYRAWQLCEALWVSDKHNLERFECIQSPYNLITRDAEYELLPLCANKDIGITVYNPLAGGLLTGKYSSTNSSREGTRFTTKRLGEMYTNRYWLDKNFDAVARLREIADAHNQSLAQFSLAWILNNETITAIIVGVSSLGQLKENLKAVELNLTAEQLTACDEAWQYISPSRFMYGR